MADYSKKKNEDKKKKEGKSILVTNYEKMAEVVRLLCVYGCYSNSDFDDCEHKGKISNTLINSDALFRKKRESIDVILGNDIKKTKNMDSKQTYSISSDRLDEDVTPLAEIYRLCTLKSMEKPVFDYIDFLYKTVYPETADSGINNRKEIMEYFGKDFQKASLFCLEIGSSKLSFEELSQLYSALMFFNGKAPYSVPGYMACDRINDYLKLSGEKPLSNEANVVFSYNNIDRILNDNAVYSIFEAIKQKKWISFNFRKPEDEAIEKLSGSEKTTKKAFCGERKYCCPLKIMYEFQNGRGYLAGWDLYFKDIRTYRLDDIFDVKSEDNNRFPEDMTTEKPEESLNENLEKIWLSISKRKKANVVIDFDENAEYIRRIVPIGTVTPVSENSCRLEADIMNFKDIVPFVRRFGEKAHISKEKSPKLYEDIKKDLREALEKYEAF